MTGLGLVVAACVAGVEAFAASPVWPTGRSDELNAHYVFTAEFARGTRDAVPTLKVAARDAYRVWVNGAFAGYGPARAAKGHARVDEWTLSGCRAGANVVSVEVTAYNTGSSYCSALDFPFVQAEVRAGDKVLAQTGKDGDFRAHAVPRERLVSRYSFQRGFGESWNVGADWPTWTTRPSGAPLALAETSAVKLLPRIVGYPDFAFGGPFRAVKGVQTRWNAAKKVPTTDFVAGLEDPDPEMQRYYRGSLLFPSKDLKVNLWDEMQRIENVGERPVADADEFALKDGDGVVFDGGLLSTGFLGLRIACEGPVRVYALFDELLTDDRDVDPTRLTVANVVRWNVTAAGTYDVEAFEPYEMKAVKIVAVGGRCRVSRPRLRTYRTGAADAARFTSDDPDVDRIFAAARETYAQNAVDVFSDCPGRERAGWLCDSWFTARTSFLLTGSTAHERLFLENFLLAEDFGDLPKGMLPMCYPARFPNGRFIPNWTMWLVLELDEYLKRSGDRALVERFRPKMLALADFFAKYENADGLLEKLPGWVFVEWSRANKLVQDVNYPSNMAYSRVLEILGRLYGRADLAAKAEKVRRAVRAQSWTGEWFCDNAVRGKDGKLVLSGERTEVCQYYAFFFGVADFTTHAALWRRLVDDFGPKRRETKAWPEIWPANAFIGNYLRLELLSRAGGLSAKILEETKGFFKYMADRTGTLWEYDRPSASCCHGFASHAAVVYARDVLGIKEIDAVGRKVRIERPSNVPLLSCAGSFPLGGGQKLEYSWSRDASGRPVESLSIPPGWTSETLAHEEIR